jgi:hypothetical protein
MNRHFAARAQPANDRELPTWSADNLAIGASATKIRLDCRRECWKPEPLLSDPRSRRF